MNRGKFGRSDLHNSCRCREELKRVETLVEQYPDALNEKDDHGFTPLYHACIFGNTDVIQVLLDHGADANTADLGGLTPLTIACEKGHAAAVEMLLRCNRCNVMHRDSIGRTPLDWAEAKGHENVLAVLKLWSRRVDDTQVSPNGAILAAGSTATDASAKYDSQPPTGASSAVAAGKSDALSSVGPVQKRRSTGDFGTGISQLVSLLGSGVSLSDLTSTSFSVRLLDPGVPLVALSRVTFGVVLAGFCASVMEGVNHESKEGSSWPLALGRCGYCMLRWLGGLVVGAVGLILIASLLGAPLPWESGAMHTALWALQAASVTTAPVATTAALPTLRGLLSFTAWQRAFFSFEDATEERAGSTVSRGEERGERKSSRVQDEGAIGRGRGGRKVMRAKWALFGAWWGACAMPLDWGSAWLQWPLPLCYGTFFGHAIGCFAAAICCADEDL